MEALFAIIGTAVGLFFGWWIASRSAAGAREAAHAQGRQEEAARAADLQNRLSAADATLAAAREDAARRDSEARDAIAARDAALAETRNALSLSEGARRETKAAADTALEAAREKLALLDEAQQKLADAFKALAAESLKSNNQSFLELAKQQLDAVTKEGKGNLETHRVEVAKLLEPVQKSLSEVDKQVQEMEKSRKEAFGGIIEQVTALKSAEEALRTETSNLVSALRRPQARGRWGELQLRRVVEFAGMLDRCDFTEQTTVSDEDARGRPDLIVRLPNNRVIAVDSKVPLDAYLAAVEATDPDVRDAALALHAKHVRDNLDGLARRNYSRTIGTTVDFTVLFLPGEDLYSAALIKDPSLLEAGWDSRVLIATPTTLIALLRSVAYGWRHQQVEESAEEIAKAGRALYERIATVADHLSKLGRSLTGAVRDYNAAIGSIETRVLPSARRIRELGATGQPEIPILSPLDSAPRPLSAPELTARGEEDDAPAE